MMKTKNILSKNGKQILIIGITLILGIIIGGIFFSSNEVTHDGHDHEITDSNEPTVYTCSMHP
ncbi:MAG: hypothetical protein KAS29_04335, partial [Bacteroidales bacterium]|nr:hypothetical protein [Bacteroidales bacterium]